MMIVVAIIGLSTIAVSLCPGDAQGGLAAATPGSPDLLVESTPNGEGEAQPVPYLEQSMMVVTTPEEVRSILQYCRKASLKNEASLRRMAFGSSDPLVASNAIRALGRLGLFQWDSSTQELLNDPRPRVQQETILAFGQSRESNALESLIAISEDQESPQRTLALRALGAIGGEQAQAVLNVVAANPNFSQVDRAFARAALTTLAATENKAVHGEKSELRRP